MIGPHADRCPLPGVFPPCRHPRMRLLVHEKRAREVQQAVEKVGHLTHPTPACRDAPFSPGGVLASLLKPVKREVEDI